MPCCAEPSPPWHGKIACVNIELRSLFTSCTVN